MKYALLVIFLLFIIIDNCISQCNLVWDRETYAYNYYEAYPYIKVTGDNEGNIYQSLIYQVIYPVNPVSEITVTKFNPEGDSLWTYDYKETGDIYHGNVIGDRKVIGDKDGNTYLSGPLLHVPDNLIGYYIFKIDKEGNLNWLIRKADNSSFRNLYFDKNNDLLLFTLLDDQTPALSKINKDGSFAWEYKFKEVIRDLTFDSNNHLHILLEDEVIELFEGSLIKTIPAPSVNLVDSTNEVTTGKIKVIKNGNDNDYLLFANGQYNHFTLIKINNLGDTIFIVHKDSTIEYDKEPHSFLEILPNGDILFGRTPESDDVEGSIFTATSTAYFVFDQKGNYKYKKNLYFHPGLNELFIDTSYIFSTGVGKNYNGQIDIFNFNGNRICESIESLDEYFPMSVYSNNKSEIYVAYKKYVSNYFYLKKFSIDKTSTSDYNAIKLAVYPNPTDHLLKIKGLEDGMEYKYSISNLIGNIISKGNTSTEDSINIENLNIGIYFISLQSGNEKKLLKFIKK